MRAVRLAGVAGAVRRTPAACAYAQSSWACGAGRGRSDHVAGRGRAHRNLHLPKSVRSQRGACHSRHSFAVRVETSHGGAVLALVPVLVLAGRAVQCSVRHGPSRHRSPDRGGAVRNPHHPLLVAVLQVAVRGVVHCSRPGRRWTTRVLGDQCPR